MKWSFDAVPGMQERLSEALARVVELLLVQSGQLPSRGSLGFHIMLRCELHLKRLVRSSVWRLCLNAGVGEG